MPSPGPMDTYSYPDPTYGGAHPLYYPGSNIRRPQSTEPEDYGLRPRGNNNNHMNNQIGNHMQNSVPMGAEWTSMPVGMHNMKEEKFVL